MSTALEKMQVEVKDREMVFTRMFDAPRQLVWDAFTHVEHLLEWWAPHGFTSRDCSVDLKVGGKMMITMVGPDGGEYPCLLIFQEIVPIEKIALTDKAVPGDHWGADGPPPDGELTLLFEELSQKQTKLVFSTKFETNEGRDRTLKMGAAKGWAELFEKLDDLLKK